MEEVFSQIEGNFVGLGVELKTEQAGLNIVNVISVGPAHEAGIRPGDRIVSVDGKTTSQVPRSVSMLQAATENPAR
jgi:carboxyl-terminal processing protease